MKPFRGVDYYRCDDLLTEEERSVRETVRRWVERRYLPKARDYFEQGVFDTDLIPQLAEIGLLGIKIKGYGGAGMSDVVYGVVVECQDIVDRKMCHHIVDKVL